jgi:hypothetical protein
MRRVAFPINGIDGMWGYALRATPETTDTLPKWFYIIDRSEERSKIAVLDCSGGVPSCSSLVLVEDIISAIKISELSPCVSLMGTRLEEKMLTLAKLYGTIYVWLDMDNHEVRKQAIRIKRQLETVGCKVKLLKTDKDPKEYSIEEIKEILNED